MFNNNAAPFTMPVVPAGYTGGGGGMSGAWGDGGWLWIIVVFALLFGWGNNGWGGNGGNNGGAQYIPYQMGSNYTDAAIQRGFDNQAVITKLDGITQGICDSTYALNNAITNGFNNTNMGMMQGFNSVERGFCNLSAQLASCCCDIERGIDGVNYNMAKNTCDLQNTMHNNTRDIIESQNAGTRAVLDALTQQRIEAKDERIAELQSLVNSLNLAQSQANQNAALMAAMDANTAQIIRRTGNDCPIPAYVVPNPNCCYGTPYGVLNNGCGCNSGCNCA